MTLARLEDHGDHLVVVNANTARRGALSPEYYQAVLKALDEARAPRVGAVILAAEGGFFCSGGDLNLLAQRRDLPAPERRARIDQLHDLVRGMRASPVPVIAAVEGGAAGAGASLALACDLIVAARGAQFTAAYVRAGLVPDAGLTSALSRLVPRALAMEMCLLGRPVAAERLAALGAVNQVVAPGDTLAVARDLAQALAAGPRRAQGQIRALVAGAYETDEAAQLDAERDAMAQAVAGDEAREGIAARLGKREPRFPR